MEKNMETNIMGYIGFRVRMEKTIESTRMGYRQTTVRIHSFIPSEPKVSLGLDCFGL